MLVTAFVGFTKPGGLAQHRCADPGVFCLSGGKKSEFREDAANENFTEDGNTNCVDVVPGSAGVGANAAAGPLAQPVEKSGNGGVDLGYNVTADDVRGGIVWKVSLRSAAAPVLAHASGPMVIDSASAPKLLRVASIEAQGTITIQHPPGDMRAAEAQLKAAAEQRKAVVDSQERQIGSQVQGMNAGQAKRISKVAPPAIATAGMPTRQAGPSLSVTNRPIPPRGMPEMTAASPAFRGTPPNMPKLAFMDDNYTAVNGAKSSEKLYIEGVFAAQNPPTEVHYVVASGADLKQAVLSFWENTVLVNVPDGIPASYDGYIYVQCGAQKSDLTPFRFEPLMEVVRLQVSGDRILMDPSFYNDWVPGPGYPDPGGVLLAACQFGHRVEHWDNGYTQFLGHKADDEFFRNTTLKNGWILDSVNFAVTRIDGAGNASVSETRISTSSPYVKVHWWIDAFSRVDYRLSVNIKGPKGVPYQ